MQLRPDDLAAHLARTVAPLYVVHGDEPLLALEAGDAIRAAARAAGCDERDVLVVEPGFKWDAFLAANANLGLFGDRKLVDLRIPTGKPGVEGGKALEAYAANPNPDNVTLITLPRLDRATQSSAWFSALAGAGVTIAVYPVERDALPALDRRAARAPAAAARRARRSRSWPSAAKATCSPRDRRSRSSRCCCPKGELDHDAVEAAVADVARYDVFELSEAWLAGDARARAAHPRALAAEGEPPTLPIWQLSEDLHALAAVVHDGAQRNVAGAAVRNARVWGKRQSALERAARRVRRRPDRAAAAPRRARLDALAKGIGRGNAWDELATTGAGAGGRARRCRWPRR